MSEISTTAIDKASDKSFRADLNAFLDDEAAAERRAELNEELAQFLIREGEEFCPWTFPHFEEAIGNAPRGDRLCAFATIAAAHDLELDNPNANRMALTALKRMVECYWLDTARAVVKLRREKSSV